jgi:ESS family glutamate:Na+ symporter
MILNAYYTLIAATVVLLIGGFLVSRVSLLAHFSIPEPVAGGLVASIVVLVLHQLNNDFSLTINEELQNSLMLMFFASIGLNADFSRLRAGGKPLAVLTVVVSAFIVVQNLIGIGMASALGLPPLTGLIAGSVTLTGGHGTAGGWGPMLEELGVPGATTVGMACATFGLILGGLTGGPVAQYLIRNLKTPGQTSLEDSSGDIAFEQPHHARLITADSALETLTMFAIALAAAHFLAGILAETFAATTVRIPTFVLALGSGIVVRNVLSRVFNIVVFDRCVDVIGNVSLSLFLAMAMLSLQLWQLVDLAIPLLLIIAVQTVVMVMYASCVTFRFLGKDYDAAVIAAGHCGFGMGATPTAVANMQAVTQKFGISHKAFLIVPLVGAFFVDIINTLMLSVFTALPFLR